jgi:AbrB family looped-hinge helix DNA binding protein
MNFIYSYNRAGTMEVIDEIVKVGERGQIVIPSKIRKKENISSNSYVRVIDVDGRIVIDKVATKPIEKIIESLVSLGLTESDWKEIQKEREDER